MNYYRRYVGDYLGKTMRLSTTEHGAYGLLLDFYYAEEKPIPLDHDEVYVICRAIQPGDRAAVDKVLAAYFDKEADGYHNARADKEIAAARQARENGARHTGKATRSPTGSATGLPTEQVTKKTTGDGTGSGHPPTTNLQPPETTKSKAEARDNTRARRLSQDWVLPKAWGTWALIEQPTWTEDHVRKVAAMFKNHWLAASGRTAAKFSWYGTWQNWVWKEPAIKGPLNGHNQPWFLKASGIEAKAKELGIKVPESKAGWSAFRDEVYQKAGVTDEMLRAAKQDAPR